MRRGRRRSPLLAAATCATALLLAVGCVSVDTSSDDEPGDRTDRAPTDREAPIDDPVWAPAGEVDGAVLRGAAMIGNAGPELTGSRARFPTALVIHRVDGELVVASLHEDEVAWEWQLPLPGRYATVDTPEGDVVVVGSRTLPLERLEQLAADTTVDQGGVVLPGEPVATVDTSDAAPFTVTMWESTDADYAEPQDGVMATWILTLEDEDQLDALLQLADPDPTPEEYTVSSIPREVLDPSVEVDVHGAEATVLTLNAYSRMIAVRSELPFVVIGNDGARYPKLFDDVLVAVARSLELVERDELAGRVAHLPVRPFPRQDEHGGSTTTTP